MNNYENYDDDETYASQANASWISSKRDSLVSFQEESVQSKVSKSSMLSEEDYQILQGRLNSMREKVGLSKTTLNTMDSETTGLSYATNSARGSGLVSGMESENTNSSNLIRPIQDTGSSKTHLNRKSSSRSGARSGTIPRRTLYDIGEMSEDDNDEDREYERSRAQHEIDLTIGHSKHGISLLEDVGNSTDYFDDGFSSALVTTTPRSTSRSRGFSPEKVKLRDTGKKVGRRMRRRDNDEKNLSDDAKKAAILVERRKKDAPTKATMKDARRHMSKKTKTSRIKVKSEESILKEEGKSSRRRKKKGLPAVMLRKTESSKLRDKQFRKEQSRLEALREQENRRPKLKLFIQPSSTDIRVKKTNEQELSKKFRWRPEPLGTKITARNVKLDTSNNRNDGNEPLIRKIKKEPRRKSLKVRPQEESRNRDEKGLEPSKREKRIRVKSRDSLEEAKGYVKPRRREVSERVRRKDRKITPEGMHLYQQGRKEAMVRGPVSNEDAIPTRRKGEHSERMKLSNEKASRKRSDKLPENQKERSRKTEVARFVNKTASHLINQPLGEMRRKELPRTKQRRDDIAKEDPQLEGDVPEYISDDNDDYISEISNSMHLVSSRRSSRRSVISAHLELGSWEELYHYLTDMEKNPEHFLVNLLRGGSEAFHTTAWKSPPMLAKKFYDMLTPDEYNMLVSTDADGNTPLHLCCANLSPSEERSINLGTLKALLDRVPECLGKQNNEKDTPMHLFLSSPLASRFVEPDITFDANAIHALELIMGNIPSQECILLKDSSGATLLHTAIANEVCEKMLEYLISMAPALCNSEDLSGRTPLHYAAAFMKTPESVVQRMIEEYSYSICHKTKEGDTPLHLLIRNASKNFEDKDDTEDYDYDNIINIVNLLMGSETTNSDKEFNEEYSPLLIQNKEKLTPFHCFALFSNAPMKIGEQMMKHSSAMKALTITNAYGATPLHICVAHANPFIDSIELFGSLDTASAQDTLKRTPLHVASQNVHISTEVISTLIEMNPLMCNKQSDGGYLPIHLAVHAKARAEIVKELHESFPSGLERGSVLGDLPLHKAVINNAPAEVVKYLLREYEGAIYVQNHVGDLPLHCAMSSGASFEIVRTLVEAWPQGVSTQNRSGSSPLHILMMNNTRIELVDLFIKSAQSALILLDSNGNSPLDVAKMNNASADVIFLLQNAAEEWTKRALDDGWSSFDDLR